MPPFQKKRTAPNRVVHVLQLDQWFHRVCQEPSLFYCKCWRRREADAIVVVHRLLVVKPARQLSLMHAEA